MKKIVFPTDFSSIAAEAMPVAAQLARMFNAELHLVHVVSPVLPGYTPRLLQAEDQYSQALGRVEQAFDDLLLRPCLNGLQVRTHVLTGVDPVDLLDDDRFANADLLVMSSTGASGLKETLLGSNAEHLIRRAKMPVLVLKNPSSYLDLKTVVLASDFQDHYDSSINFLKDLLDGFDYPAVHLLFVNTVSHFVPTHEVLPRMNSFVSHYGLSGCTINQRDEFDVETGLLTFARDEKADLIVLGTHGWRGLRHLLQGSVAEDVVNHASIPVLILPLKTKQHPPMVILDGLGAGFI